MAKYEKLVRDRIPEILDAKGVAYDVHAASDSEYRTELVKKLLEEAQEFAEAAAPGELADVLEVIAALRTLPEYSEVEALRAKKAEERGAFEKRLIASGDDGK
jgi:predicted house-cleaning noncanonical NTP pyrophosphatase (MazG superfamily)